MDADDLDRKARLRAWVNRISDELRSYGVPEARIRRCRTALDLAELHSTTVRMLMQHREPAKAELR